MLSLRQTLKFCLLLIHGRRNLRNSDDTENAADPVCDQKDDTDDDDASSCGGGGMNAVATINSREGMTGRQLSVPHKH